MQYMVIQCCKTIDAATTKSQTCNNIGWFGSEKVTRSQKDVNLKKKNVLIFQQ